MKIFEKTKKTIQYFKNLQWTVITSVITSVIAFDGSNLNIPCWSRDTSPFLKKRAIDADICWSSGALDLPGKYGF